MNLNQLKQKQVLLGFGIIAAAIVVSALLFVTAPEAEKRVVSSSAPLVQTVEARTNEAPVAFTAFGTVQPNRELTVQAEVSGRVIEQSSDLDAGGLLEEGQVMLKVDPRNYLMVVDQEKAAVKKAEFELLSEKGRQVIAKREWELLGSETPISEISEELALRKPHLREKEAALTAAQSRLEKAILDLRRTVLRAPFNAMVTEEFVEVGQLLSSSTKVATLISTDEFRVQVNVPYDQLSSIKIPTKDDASGSPVKVTQDLGGSQKIVRDGRVLRLLGTLDPKGRMARILVVIDDPLGLENSEYRQTPLLVGTYVSVEIEGGELHNAITLPRAALREGEKVWVVADGDKLEIRDVEIASKTRDSIIVINGIEPEERVIVSSLPVAIPGMEVRPVNKE